jgi:hypothetical protein
MRATDPGGGQRGVEIALMKLCAERETFVKQLSRYENVARLKLSIPAALHLSPKESPP